MILTVLHNYMLAGAHGPKQHHNQLHVVSAQHLPFSTDGLCPVDHVRKNIYIYTYASKSTLVYADKHAENVPQYTYQCDIPAVSG